MVFGTLSSHILSLFATLLTLVSTRSYVSSSSQSSSSRESSEMSSVLVLVSRGLGVLEAHSGVVIGISLFSASDAALILNLSSRCLFSYDEWLYKQARN